jgi:hypothetical protein
MVTVKLSLKSIDRNRDELKGASIAEFRGCGSQWKIGRFSEYQGK